VNQSAPAAFSGDWLWISIPLAAASAAALWFLISGLIALLRKAQLLRAPLAEKQEVQFAEPGRVLLCVEGPHLTRRFAHIRFELRGLAGDPVEGRMVLLRTKTSGLRTTRLALLRYDLPRAGRYVLRLEGLGAQQPRDSEHAVVFTRPRLKQTVAYVVGIVAASCTLIGSLALLLIGRLA
jgi:hypothetical protein